MAKTDKTTDTAETKTAETTAKIKALRVRAFNDHFRRAGITFGKEERVIKLDDLTAEQVAQIKSEPMLAVSDIEAIVTR